MKTLTLRKGSKLYRVPASDTQKDVFGNYYSRTNLACYYAQDTDDNVYTFKSTRSLKLVDFSKESTFEYLYTTLKDKDLELFKIITGYGLTELRLETKDEMLCYYKNKSKFQPKFCIIGFINELDQSEDIYLNKKFAKLLCSLGYDGVLIPTAYEFMWPRQKHFLNKLFGYKESYSSEYEEDIFICNPAEVLDVFKVELASSSKLCKDIDSEE